MRVDLLLDKKIGKSGLGHQASGPPDLRAAGPPGRRGPWAARPQSHRGPAFSKVQRSVVVAVVCMYIFSQNKSRPVIVVDAFTRGLKEC